MTVKAVILDAFGTILSGRASVQPYPLLFKEGLRQGRRPTPNDARLVITLDCGLEGAAEHLGIHLPQGRLAEIQAVLDTDLASMEPFGDALAGIELLQKHSVAIAVCSNLAQPYGAVVSSLFPNLDVYAYSYQLGILKPEPQMYNWACDLLSVTQSGAFGSGDVVRMIGDSIRCDRDGPTAVGITGHLLDRRGGGQMTSLLEFAEMVVPLAHWGARGGDGLA
jgi:FMN phosphatase YigB (HAD superfamily)